MVLIQGINKWVRLISGFTKNAAYMTSGVSGSFTPLTFFPLLSSGKRILFDLEVRISFVAVNAVRLYSFTQKSNNNNNNNNNLIEGKKLRLVIIYSTISIFFKDNLSSVARQDRLDFERYSREQLSRLK